MSELQPGIETEMAGNLRETDGRMRSAAAGVLSAHLNIVGCTPESAMDQLFQSFPGDGSTILLAIMALETLRTEKRWTEQNVKDRCDAIVRDEQSSVDSVTTAEAVMKSLGEIGHLRQGAAALTGELLRSVHTTSYADPSYLARATGNESNANQVPLEDNHNDSLNSESRQRFRWQFWKR